MAESGIFKLESLGGGGRHANGGRNKNRLCGCPQVFTLSRLRSSALCFCLLAHKRGAANCSLRVERSFHFTRNNFLTLASRSLSSSSDLHQPVCRAETASTGIKEKYRRCGCESTVTVPRQLAA